MSTTTTYAEAEARLRRMVAAAEEPTLDDAAIADLLVMTRTIDADRVVPDTYAPWEALTVYALGIERVPTVRNGRYYAVTTGGTTGASEPAWPTTDGGTVTDGTVVWTEQGAAPWDWAFDLNRAAAEGWRWKAAVAANRFSFQTESERFDRNQIVAHCQQMAEMYRKRITDSVPVLGPTGAASPVHPRDLVTWDLLP